MIKKITLYSRQVGLTPRGATLPIIEHYKKGILVIPWICYAAIVIL